MQVFYNVLICVSVGDCMQIRSFSLQLLSSGVGWKRYLLKHVLALVHTFPFVLSDKLSVCNKRYKSLYVGMPMLHFSAQSQTECLAQFCESQSLVLMLLRTRACNLSYCLFCGLFVLSIESVNMPHLGFYLPIGFTHTLKLSAYFSRSPFLSPRLKFWLYCLEKIPGKKIQNRIFPFL